MKQIVMTLLLCSIAFVARAGKALVVELKGGGTMMFVLSQKPEVSFSNHTVYLRTATGNAAFQIDAVSQFYFTDSPMMGIGEKTVKPDIWMTQQGDQYVIEGIEATDRVRLYALDGKGYADGVEQGDGYARVSLQGLPKGTYVISISNRQAFKILRK